MLRPVIWFLFSLALLIDLAHAADDWTYIDETELHPPKVDEWVVLHGGTLRGIVRLNNVMVAVGDHGAILRSRDSGETWEPRPSGTNNVLWAVTALEDRHTLIAVGTNGTILRSRDGGDSWELRPSKTEQSLLDVTSLGDGRTLVAVGAYGVVVGSIDAGENWFTQLSGNEPHLAGVTALPDRRTIVAVGRNGTVLRSQDAGENWVRQVSGTEIGIAAVTKVRGTTLIAVGDSGLVLRSDDAGQSWVKVRQPTANDPNLSSVAFLGDREVLVAVGDYGTVMTSHDLGSTWRIEPNVTDRMLWGVTTLADNRTLLAIGAEGTAIRSLDGGASWKAWPSTRSQALWGVVAIDRRTVVAVGNRGTIMRSTTSGARWEVPSSGTDQDLSDVIALADGQTLIAVGSRGTVLRSKDAGENWDSRHTGIDVSLSSIIAISDGQTLVAVGDRGVVLRSQDAGETWEVRQTAVFQKLQSVVALGDGKTLIAVGDRGTVLRSRDAGASWEWRPSGVAADIAYVTATENGQTLIAVGEGGIVLRSRDSGEGWERRYSGVSQKLQNVIALEDGRTLIAVGDAGVILRSPNQGGDWELESSGAEQQNLFGIAQLPDTRTLIVVGSNGTLLRNRAFYWETRFNGNDKNFSGVVALARGDVLVAVTWDGTLLRSTNHGTSWAAISNGIEGLLALRGITSVGHEQTLVAVGDGGLVLRSQDGGLSWEERPSRTDQNFTAIAASPDGHTVIAVGDGGLLLLSRNSGRTWERRPSGTDQNLTSVTALPNGRTLIAVGERGTTLRTQDGGDTWTATPPRIDQHLFAVAGLSDGRTVIAAGERGAMQRSSDSGDNWEVWASGTNQTLWAITSLPRGQSFVSVGDGGTVLRSEDGGLNWVLQRVHTDKILRAVTPVGNEAIAVGLGGVVSFPVGVPGIASAASEFRFTAKNDALTVAWRYPEGKAATCYTAFFNVVGTKQPVGTLPPVRQLLQPSSRMAYSVTWSPGEMLRAAMGTEFQYTVECGDPVLGISWRQRLPGLQSYRPISVWEKIKELPDWSKGILIVTLLLVFWLFVLIGLYALAPTNLVALHEALPGPKSLDQLAAATGKTKAGVAKLLRFFGVAALLWLGTSRRALDAWCATRLPAARRQFSLLKLVSDRRIALDLPVVMDGERFEQPWPALDLLFRRPSVALLIWGPGGAGKTTLACQIGQRMLADKGEALGGFACLPLIIDRDLKGTEAAKDFVPFLAGVLRVAVGETRLSTALAEALLRSGRVLVIVDGVSERDETTRRSFDPARPAFPIMRLIATSRNPSRGGMGASLEMLEIPPDGLYTFLSSYLSKSGAREFAEADIHEACAQLKRLLRETKTTPLFASLWAEELLRGKPDSTGRIQGSAELIDSYVERLLAPVGEDAVALDTLRSDVSAIGIRELGDGYTPRWLTRAQILESLRNLSEEKTETRLTKLVESRLIEADTRNPEFMRVTLDPVAEHLVARFRTEDLADDAERWREFLAELPQNGCPKGFLESLQACLHHRVYGQLVPQEIRLRLLGPNPLEAEVTTSDTNGPNNEEPVLRAL